MNSYNYILYTLNETMTLQSRASNPLLYKPIQTHTLTYIYSSSNFNFMNLTRMTIDCKVDTGNI